MEEIGIFIFLLGILFLVPKLVKKLDIPEQITEIILGLILGPFFLGVITDQPIIEVMGTIGIITLFFVAGFEVDVRSIVKKKKTLLENGVLHIILICLIAAVIFLTGKSITTALMIGIALVTPSAGFILGAVRSLQLHSYLVEWIETKVISAEVLSLLLLLIITNLSQPIRLVIVITGFIAICFLLPYILEFFFLHILGKTNMQADTFFIFVIAVSLAFATHVIGVHYIIGAFIVGLIMRWANESKHNQTTLNEERVLSTFSSFTTIFVPFYFFSVGLMITKDMISWKNVLFAIVIFGIVITIKIFTSFVHRRLTLKESFKASTLVALLTAPTLLFTFVTAQILYDAKSIAESTYGVLIIYGLLTAGIPLIANAIEKWTKKARYA